MAKNKTALHKVVIHHNRWFFWAIALSVIAGIALVGYIKVASQAFDNDAIFVPHAVNNWKQFTQSERYFSINVPPNWTAREDNGVVSLTSKADVFEFLSITPKPAARESAARASLVGFGEMKLTVGGIEASMFTPKQDGERYVLVKNNDKLFVIKSNSKELERILATLVFIK